MSVGIATFNLDYGTCYRCGKKCGVDCILVGYIDQRTGEANQRTGEMVQRKLCGDCWIAVCESIKPLGEVQP